MSVLVVGNAVLDIAYRVPHLPRPGETLLRERPYVDVGGKGLNQAIAARRAGADVRLLAPSAATPRRTASVRRSRPKASTRTCWSRARCRPTNR